MRKRSLDVIIQGITLAGIVGAFSYLSSPKVTISKIQDGYQIAGEIIERLNPIPDYHEHSFQHPIASTKEDTVCVEDNTVYSINKDEFESTYH